LTKKSQTVLANKAIEQVFRL